MSMIYRYREQTNVCQMGRGVRASGKKSEGIRSTMGNYRIVMGMESIA